MRGSLPARYKSKWPKTCVPLRAFGEAGTVGSMLQPRALPSPVSHPRGLIAVWSVLLGGPAAERPTPARTRLREPLAQRAPSASELLLIRGHGSQRPHTQPPGSHHRVWAGWATQPNHQASCQASRESDDARSSPKLRKSCGCANTANRYVVVASRVEDLRV